MRENDSEREGEKKIEVESERKRGREREMGIERESKRKREREKERGRERIWCLWLRVYDSEQNRGASLLINTPPPLGPPQDPNHSPVVGSWGGCRLL